MLCKKKQSLGKTKKKEKKLDKVTGSFGRQGDGPTNRQTGLARHKIKLVWQKFRDSD